LHLNETKLWVKSVFFNWVPRCWVPWKC